MATESKTDQTETITIDRPDCAPMSISISASKRGVAIVIRVGSGSEDLPAFGKKPTGGGVQAFGPDPGDGGCF